MSGVVSRRRERRKVAHVTRDEFNSLCAKVDENTCVTIANAGTLKEVHDILTGLKVMAHIGKWVTVIAVAVTAVVAAIRALPWPKA